MKIEIAAIRGGRLTAWHVRRVLKWFDSEDLEGLDRIRVLDYEPDDPAARAQPPYLVGFLYNGRYVRRKKNRSAAILLFTSDLYFPVPWILWASPVATLRVASILAHEVGHHMMEAHDYSTPTSARRHFPASAPVDPDKEAIADNYAHTVMNRMLGCASYRIAAVVARAVSYYLFELGNWWSSKGNLRRAARLEFRAYFMDKQNTDAWQSYLLDRQALLRTPSALTEQERRWLSVRS